MTLRKARNSRGFLPDWWDPGGGGALPGGGVEGWFSVGGFRPIFGEDPIPGAWEVELRCLSSELLFKLAARCGVLISLASIPT